MVRRLSVGVCLLSLLVGVFAQQPPPGTPNPAAEGRKYLDMLLAGKYSEFFQAFTPKMQEMVTEETLRTKVGPTLQRFGKVENIGEAKLQLAGGARVILIPVKFTGMALNFRITIDDQNKIAGLYFQPVQQPVAAYVRPAYGKPESFKESVVTFGMPEWQLPATLTIPAGKGPFPVVVLVHGSGPNDRDESVGPNKPFRDLAEGLASKGIAVFRYEKRTRQYAGRMAADRDITVKEEVVDDAVAAAEFARQQPGVDPKRVFVLGHSLGGYLGPRIAAQDGKLAGLIIMAGTARPLEDIVEEQLDYVSSLPGQPAEAKAHAAQVKQQLEQLKKPDPPKDLVVMGMPAHYLTDLHSYDPAGEAAKLTIPILVLQGERDYQATMKDFGLWSKALDGHKNATLHSYAALNHLFMTGQGKATPAEYEKESHVAPEVVDELATWVAAH